MKLISERVIVLIEGHFCPLILYYLLCKVGPMNSNPNSVTLDIVVRAGGSSCNFNFKSTAGEANLSKMRGCVCN